MRPHDESFRKMRVCRYEVVGNYGTQLSSTVHHEDEVEDDGDLDAEEDLDKEKNDRQMAAQAELEGNVSTEEDPAPVVKVPRRFARLHAMGLTDLLQQPIAKLRTYAYKGLKIVGATKIAGGRAALVDRILKTRNGNKAEE